MNFRVYGLLHCCDSETSTENAPEKNFQAQMQAYVACAQNLSNSFKSNEIEFTLLTNNAKYLSGLIDPSSGSLKLQEIQFLTEVPSGIKFYSAHYKLDALKYLASLEGSYVALCDLDVVCINNLPCSFANNVSMNIPMCYDISDQVLPAYGTQKIVNDLQSIHGQESEGRWSGGEFISGTSTFFSALTEEIDKLYPNYVKNIGNLHHVGDEAIVSAAIEVLRRTGIYIADAGTIGLIGRFWSIPILHTQKAFNYYKGCWLLHLPADKGFLARMAKVKLVNSSDFGSYCTSYMRISRIVRYLPTKRLRVFLADIYLAFLR